MARSETAQRVLVAAVGAPLAAGAVYLGGWVLAALLALVAVLGTLELYRLAAAKGLRPLPALGAGAAALWLLLAAFEPTAGPATPALAALLTTLVLAALVAVIWTHGVEGQPLLGLAVTVIGVLYTAGLLAYGLFLRHLPGVESRAHGTALVFAPVLLTWANDTFAYFVGRRFGRHKLIPRVSPGKTVEGAAGALVGTVAVALGYAFALRAFESYRLGPGQAVLFGLLVALAAQVGDLAESLLKRDAGVKDSGRLLPGHGGALDRVDSLLFTLPLAYFFFRYLVGAAAPGALG